MELTNEFWLSVPWEDIDCRHWQPIVMAQLMQEQSERFATDWALAPTTKEESAT